MPIPFTRSGASIPGLGVGVFVGVIVGVDVGVGVGVEVGVGVMVGVGVSVGPNNCPGPQPERNKLITRIPNIRLRCLWFMHLPASITGAPGVLALPLWGRLRNNLFIFPDERRSEQRGFTATGQIRGGLQWAISEYKKLPFGDSGGVF